MKPFDCLILVFFCHCVPAHADREWYEVKTGDVRIVSAVGKAQTQKIAADVEFYFEAAQRIIERPHVRPLVPLNMLALDARLWRKYVDGDGRSVGRFQSFPGSAEIIIDATAWGGNSSIVFHELTHFVLRQNEPSRALPPWYNEGHAELLSTIQIRGGNLTFGIYPKKRWQSLQWLPRLPIEKVLTVGLAGEEEIHHRDDIAAFYAQAWLIVHHSLFASPARNEQLRRYRQLLLAERAPRVALESAFGSELDKYEKELSQYAQRGKLAYISLPIDSLNTRTPEVQPLSEADGLNALGRWFVYATAVDDTQLKFLYEQAKHALPDSVAKLQFANALIKRGNPTTAQPLVAAGCGAPTAMHLALLCGDAYRRQFESSRDPSLAANARKFYEAALRLQPDNLEVLLSAAATFEAAPADSARVRAGLESALQRNPNNSWISASLAALYRPLDLQKAREYLERAMLTAPSAERERIYAQELNKMGSEVTTHL